MNRVLCQKINNSLCKIGEGNKSTFSKASCGFMSAPKISIDKSGSDRNIVTISEPEIHPNLEIAKYYILPDIGDYKVVWGETGTFNIGKNVQRFLIRAEDVLGNLSPIVLCEVGNE